VLKVAHVFCAKNESEIALGMGDDEQMHTMNQIPADHGSSHCCSTSVELLLLLGALVCA
jgi:hypothetical protein